MHAKGQQAIATTLGDKSGAPPPDWVKDNKTNQVHNDPSVHDPSQVKDGESYVGKTVTAVNSDGDTRYGDENGQWWNSVMINQVSVNGSQSDDPTDKLVTGTGMATAGILSFNKRLSNAGLLNDDDSKLIGNLEYLGNGLAGTAIVTDFNNFIRHPTRGNGLRVAWDGVITFLGPEAGLADGAFSASGYKSKMFNGIDNWYDNRISKAAIDSFKVN